jgi:hypothetical protein
MALEMQFGTPVCHLDARGGLSYDRPLPPVEHMDCVCLTYGRTRRIPGFRQAKKFLGCRAGNVFLAP